MVDGIINVLGAVFTGLISLVGVIITNNMSNKTIENKLITSQAVTDTKIENLTNEVKKHNDFASRIPVIENRVDNIEKEIKEIKSHE